MVTVQTAQYEWQYTVLTRRRFRSRMTQCPVVCPSRQTLSTAALESRQHSAPKMEQCQQPHGKHKQANNAASYDNRQTTYLLHYKFHYYHY